MSVDQWLGPAGDVSWFTAGNWSLGVPVAQEATSFKDGGNWMVSLAGTAQANCGALTITGDTLTLADGTLQADAAPPKHGTPLDLTLNASSGLTIAVNATFISNNEMLTYGALLVHGTLDASWLVMAGGSMNVSGRKAHVTLSQIQTLYVGAGTLTVSQGGTLDAGPDTLKDFYSYAAVGSGLGAGAMLVEGKGSTVTLAHIQLGNGHDGTLDVLHGGTVDAGVVAAGSGGDGYVNVSGAGSTLDALNAVQIGDVNVLPVASTLAITNHGSVNPGTYGVELQYGTLKLDASAQLSGFIVSQVGKIEAISDAAAPKGFVHLNNDIYLEANNGSQGQYDYTTNVFSNGGATLDLNGAISGDSTTILSAGSGRVILENPSNDYGSTQIYDARLEIGATGAAGTGSLTFGGGAGATHAVLQLDRNVSFGNTILGFAGADSIDVRGFAFDTGVTGSYAPGELVFSNSSTSDTLSITGNYTAADFAFAPDQQGGTLIRYVHG